MLPWRENTDEQKRTQELQTVAQFMPYLVGTDERSKQFAATMIGTLTSTKIAAALAVQNQSEGTVQGLRSIAENSPNRTDRQIASDALDQMTCTAPEWPMKILTDPESGLIDFSHPISATVREMQSVVRPQLGEQISRPGRADRKRDSVEKKIYLIRAVLKKIYLESSGDYKLVLADTASSNQTMTAKIPAPQCAVGSSYHRQFQKVRDVLLEDVLPWDAATVPENTKVEVEGVGYFSSFRHQDGMAPNGLELHPVIKLTLVAPGNRD
ncbi:MAG: hypothetical protein ABSD74_05190 [Rhizomicrobium sp.]|jgi:hypothetical protein